MTPSAASLVGLTGRLRRASSAATGNRSVSRKRKPSGRAVNAAARDGAEHVVHERQQRRHRSEADRNRPPRIAFGPQSANERHRFVQHAHVRVAKAVDRLLPIADDEHRGRERVRRGAQPLAPVAHQLRDQIPLRAAGVLKLVDEHMPIAGLEPKSAVGELVHLLQKLHGAFEDAGEIEQRARLEIALILPQRHREDPPDAARLDHVQIASESAQRFGDGRRDRRGRLAVPPPGVVAVAVSALVAGAGKGLVARPAVLRHEVAAQAIDEHSEGRASFAGLERQLVDAAAEQAQIGREHREVRMRHRSIGQERIQPARDLRQDVAQPSRRHGGTPSPPSGRAARARGTAAAPEARRACGRAAPQCRCAVAARPAARTPAPRHRPLWQCARQIRNAWSSDSPTRRGTSVSSARSNAGSTSASSGNSRSSDRQKASMVETAISPRRSLRSRHLTQIDRRQPADVTQTLDDALAHLGGGLSGERDGEDMVGIDAGAQQIDVAIDQDTRLAGAGRRLEHDVSARVDGRLASR